ERLELSRVSPLDSKSSASTSSATFARADAHRASPVRPTPVGRASECGAIIADDETKTWERPSPARALRPGRGWPVNLLIRWRFCRFSEAGADLGPRRHGAGAPARSGRKRSTFAQVRVPIALWVATHGLFEVEVGIRHRAQVLACRAAVGTVRIVAHR